MKEGWKYVKFKEAGTFISGYTPKKDELKVLGSIPYFKVAEMNLPGNERFLQHTNLFVDNARKTIPANSIVFPKNGGAIYTEKKRILSFDSIIDLNTEAIVPNENVALRDFIFYFLSFIKISSFDNGGGLPSVNITKMADSKIPVPPLSEQQQIVDFLDAEFAKIDELKNQAEQSLQNAKDLFQAALKEMLTPKEGWKEFRIGDICILKSGDSKTNKSPLGDVPYIKVAEMTLPGNEVYITYSTTNVDREFNKKVIIPKGSIIFPKRGGAILTNKKRIVSKDICCDLNIMAVIPGNNIISTFLYLYFLNIDFRDMFNGATIPQLNNCDIAPMNIWLPTIEEQQIISDKVFSLKEKIENLQSNYTRTIQLCADLKQALLRQVFE